MQTANPTSEALADVSAYQSRIRAVEHDAQVFAAWHGFDIDTLMFERDRYASGGSLRTTFDGDHQYRMRCRALEIARARRKTA